MDLAAKVGLQLLLEPQASSLIFRAACCTTGVIYPVYASFKVLESSSQQKQAEKDDEQWLTYWAVYGLFSLLEDKSVGFLKVMPFYYHAKFVFLLWLMIPQTQGAKTLYQGYLRPTLRRFQPKIDVILQHCQSTLLMMYAIYKVPIDAAAAAAMMALTQAKAFLVWLSQPDDQSEDSTKKAGQFITKP